MAKLISMSLLLFFGTSLEGRNMFSKSATIEDLGSLSGKIQELQPLLREHVLEGNWTVEVEKEIEKHVSEVFMCCPRAVNFDCDDDYKVRERVGNHRCGKYGKEAGMGEVGSSAADEKTIAAAAADHADVLLDDAKSAGRPTSNHYRCQLCVYEEYIVDKFCGRGSEGICFDIKFGCDWYSRSPTQVVEINSGSGLRPYSHCIEYQTGEYYPRP